MVVSFTNDEFTVYGETHAHDGIESELLYFRLRTKVKIVAFNVKQTRVGKNIQLLGGMREARDWEARMHMHG